MHGRDEAHETQDENTEKFSSFCLNIIGLKTALQFFCLIYTNDRHFSDDYCYYYFYSEFLFSNSIFLLRLSCIYFLVDEWSFHRSIAVSGVGKVFATLPIKFLTRQRHTRYVHVSVLLHISAHIVRHEWRRFFVPDTEYCLFGRFSHIYWLPVDGYFERVCAHERSMAFFLFSRHSPTSSSQFKIHQTHMNISMAYSIFIRRGLLVIIMFSRLLFLRKVKRLIAF